MKQRAQVIIITVFVIVMLVTSFVFAINHKNKNLNYFSDSGYVISSLGKEEIDNVNKLYFKQNTAYKSNSDNGYTFSNSDGEKVEIPQESFVHYSNGSIMSLKKGVAIDLNEIDSKIIKYYNIFEGSVLNKETNLYKINNLDETITFSKLMYKISDNKYLIAYPNIIIMFSDDQTAEMKDYVEIEYVSKDVIRIYNEESNYQTIASNLYILVDDVKINLEYKIISKKDVEYLTMADMIINANDNIEVLPIPEKIETEEKEETQENISTNNGGSSNNSGGGANNNSQGQINPDLQEGLDNIITEIPNENEQVADEKIIQPTFKVDSMTINALGIQNITLSFVDESAILYGNRKVEILENSTGKVVKTFDEWEEGNPEYSVNSYFELKPNTEYTFNVTGQYKIEDTIYDRVFISKIFRTLDIGLEVVDDYITSDSLSFNVYKNDYANIKGFKYEILNKDGSLVETATDFLTFESNDYVLITEKEKFSPNTNYTLVIKDIQYGDDIFLTDFYEQLKVTYETKTLKQNPFKDTKIQLTASVDNRENTASFSVEGLNDINSGIKGYTYNIYSSNDEENPKYTIEKDRSEALILSFDELQDLKESSIYFNVKINFDDNEKTIIYTSANSNSVSLTGVQYPKIVEFKPDKDNKDGERLAGTIVIDDSEGFTELNQISNYKIVIKENDNSILGNNQQEIASIDIELLRRTEKFEIPIDYRGSIPNTEYVIYVYLVDSKNDGGVIKQDQIYLGYVTAKTNAPEPVYLKLSDASPTAPPSNKDAVFDIKIQKAYEEKGGSDERLRYLEFKLHYCTKSKTDSSEICSVISDKEGGTKFKATLPENQNQDTEFNEMLKDYTKSVTIYSNSFNFYIGDYQKEYSRYYVTVEGYSYYPIPIILIDEEGNEKSDNTFDIEFNEMEPYVKLGDPSEIKYSDSNNDGSLNVYNLTNIGKTLYDDTIVGFKFEINTTPSPKDDKISKVHYKIVNCATPLENLTELNGFSHVDISSNTKNYINIAIDDNVKRGTEYCLAYYGEYKPINSEQLEETKTTTMQKTGSFRALKQPVNIEGYLKSYDGTNAVFNLTINDPDESMINDSLCLYNTDTEKYEKPTNINNNDFTFVTAQGATNTYKLQFDECLQESCSENRIVDIYEFTQNSIVSFTGLELNIDTDTAGKVILKLSKDTNNSDNISGVTLEKNGNKGYFNFKRDEEGNMFVELNLSDIQKNGYATLDGDKLTFGTVQLNYDSGKIIEPSGNNNFYLKLLNNQFNNNLDYYNKNLEDYSFISMDSIFNKDESEELGISTGILKNNKKIGKILLNNLIHFNENATVIPNLCEKNDDQVNCPVSKTFEVQNIISTSKIDTVYTSTGAKVSFSLTNTNIITGTEIKVSLNNGNNAIITKTEDGWSEPLESELAGNIKSVSVGESNSFDVEFTDLSRESEYKYAISYRLDDNSSFENSYNDVTQKENGELNIGALKELKTSEIHAEIETVDWKWENGDIKYYKNLKTNFTVDTSNYYLNDNEEIQYSIQLIRDGNQKILVENEVLASNNSKNFNLEEESYKDYVGTYQVIVKPILKIGNEKIDLEEISLGEIFISRNEPSMDVQVLNAKPIFNITLEDHDGRLTGCDYNPANNNILGFVNDASATYFTGPGVNFKVVYFELYKDNQFFGYSPIPFANYSSTLDLSTYFNDNKLPSGDYVAKIQYCTKDKTGIQTVDFGAFKIFNSNLDVDFLRTAESFILVLKDPDTTLKDSIKRIVYQITTEDNNIISFTLSNLDDTINVNNNIEYVSSGSNYFLGLGTGGRLTDTIKHLQVSFYTSNDASSHVQTVTYTT